MPITPSARRILAATITAAIIIGAIIAGAIALKPPQTHENQVTIQCSLEITVTLPGVLKDKYHDSLRIGINDNPERLLISGEGMNYNFSIDTMRNYWTRDVINNSNTNEWRITRTDEQGEAMRTQRIIIDRNTGSIIYEEIFNRMDGKLPPLLTRQLNT